MTKSEWPDGRDPGGPGEAARPGGPRLDRAPGERYLGGARATATGTPADGGRPTPVDGASATAVAVANEPRIGLAATSGALAAVGVALAWALAVGLLDITWGLVLVAALGGWVVGTAAAFGAWRGVDHRPDRRVQGIATVSAALAWLVGTLGAYLIALVVLPASDLSLGERIAAVPFTEALVTQFSLVDVASIVLLAAIAWRSAR